MAGFKVDYNEATEIGFDKVADGTYEVVVNFAKEDVTPSGAEHIQFDLIIRNDVDQKFKNSHVFYRVWRSKETGKYHRGMIQGLAKAFGLQDGKDYASFEDFLQDFSFKMAKVTVKNEKSTYTDRNGEQKESENLNVKKIAPTAFPNLQHTFKESASKNDDPFGGGQSVDIQDDDLPF